MYVLQQSTAPSPPTTTGAPQPLPPQTHPPHMHAPPGPHPYFSHHPPHGYSAYGVPYFRPPMMMGAGNAHHPHHLPPAGQQLPPPVRPLPPPVVPATSTVQGKLLNWHNFLYRCLGCFVVVLQLALCFENDVHCLS